MGKGKKVERIYVTERNWSNVVKTFLKDHRIIWYYDFLAKSCAWFFVGLFSCKILLNV